MKSLFLSIAIFAFFSSAIAQVSPEEAMERLKQRQAARLTTKLTTVPTTQLVSPPEKVQELEKLIEQLRQQVAQLEKENKALKDLNNKLYDELANPTPRPSGRSIFD
jgi:TolA-binding protein